MSRIGRMVLFLGALGCVVLAGCTAAVAPVRTLPEHIKRIYVREFKNGSRMFGAQADLTLAVQDEFISDGRLDVVQNERADVRLEGRIKHFREFGNASGDDEFPLVSTLEMICTIELWDPYDTDRVAPMARYTVPASTVYVSDSRRSYSETQTEAKERLMREMAKAIVRTVLTGGGEPLEPIEQKAIQKYEQRRGPKQHEPIITQPRFPKPVSSQR